MAGADAVVCLVTAPPDRAHDIAEALVAKRLAACVNIVVQVHSVYRWEGAVTRDEESLLIVKSLRPAVPAIEDELRRVHPYDTFELIALDVADGAAPYLSWIGESVEAR
jgi:periplasmic divalent cation tolerance protein